MVDLNATATVIGGINQIAFTTTDYIVFILMLSVSTCIGIYFGFFANGADTTEEYLLGGKRMKTIPIAISLVASQLSAISIMTIPAELYAFGINLIFSILAMVVIVPILCWIVIPVFYNNEISNCYEYLQIRFNSKTRKLLTFAFIATLFFMLPVFIFIPSMAFSQVTGLNVHLINIVVCAICVFYTMVGGIKAVVWTDCIQAGVMLVSVILVVVLGVQAVGGLGEVIRIADEGQRLDVNFAFDLTTRGTFWNFSIASTVMWVTYVGLNQSCVQRIVALPSLSNAKRSLQYFGIGFMFILGLTSFTGILMYARYHYCDPIKAGLVEKPDKLMAYFVQDIAGQLTGMPGIFISAVFSAALSTMSANLNALSGVVYFDYIKPFIRHTEHRANVIMKMFVFIMGIYSILGGWVVQNFRSIFQLMASIGGMTMGAVLGVFFLGFLIPKAHGRAAFWSTVIGMFIMAVIVMGAQGVLHYQPLPTSLDGCENLNITTTIATNSSTLLKLAKHSVPEEDNFNIFKISFNWYAPIGACLTFFLGIILSCILPPENERKLDPKLLSPIVQPFVRSYQLTEMDEVPDVATKPSTNN